MDSATLPESFKINGQSVRINDVQKFLVDQYGPPLGGYYIKSKGDDGRIYYISAAVDTRHTTYPGEIYWSPNGIWDVDFHDTKEEAEKSIKAGRIYVTKYWRRSYYPDDADYQEQEEYDARDEWGDKYDN